MLQAKQTCRESILLTRLKITEECLLMCNKFSTRPCKPIAIDVFSPDINITLFGSLAVMIHTHWELLSYWIGKLGDVKVPEGP